MTYHYIRHQKLVTTHQTDSFTHLTRLQIRDDSHQTHHLTSNDLPSDLLSATRHNYGLGQSDSIKTLARIKTSAPLLPDGFMVMYNYELNYNILSSRLHLNTFDFYRLLRA